VGERNTCTGNALEIARTHPHWSSSRSRHDQSTWVQRGSGCANTSSPLKDTERTPRSPGAPLQSTRGAGTTAGIRSSKTAYDRATMPDEAQLLGKAQCASDSQLRAHSCCPQSSEISCPPSTGGRPRAKLRAYPRGKPASAGRYPRQRADRM